MKLVKVTILGKVFEGDFLNPDNIETYERAIDLACKKTEETMKSKKESEAIRGQCNAICECADTILGDGASKKLFPESVDLLSCLDLFDELCSINKKQLVPLINQRRTKYSLERLQRGKHTD